MASKLNFFSRLKIYVLIVFKVIRSIIFSAVKRVSFPQSRNFLTVKKVFHKTIFIWSRKFFTMKEFFHSHRIFPAKKNYLIQEILHKQRSFPQFFFSLIWEVLWKKDFYTIKQFSKNKDIKGSLKAKIIFNPLIMPVSNKSSYVLTQRIGFFSTCGFLLMNIKKLLLFTVLTECTSIQTN